MSAAQPAAPPSRGLGPILVTLFLDLVGFSLIFTIIPDILVYYLPGSAAEGAGRTDALAEWLAAVRDATLAPYLAGRGFDAAAISAAAYTLFGGILAGSYSLLQFLAAPFWGGYSDRRGRRATLLVTVAWNTAAYALWAVAPSFGWFVLSRMLSGVFAGNISIASAYVADVTAAKDRVRGMGLVGMAIGLGFIFGPALGGLAYQVLPRVDGLPPFAGVAALAALLNAANWVQIYLRLAEPPARAESPRFQPGDVLKAVGGLAPESGARPGFGAALAIQFVEVAIFAAFEFTLAFFFAFRFGYDAADRTWLFLYTGLVLAFTQGGISRRLSGRMPEKHQIGLGLGLFIPGFILYALGAGEPGGVGQALCIAAVGLLSLAAGILAPALSSFASLAFDPARQGLGMGYFRGIGALGRVAGPFLGGALYFLAGPATLFAICALAAIMLFAFAIQLPAGADAE